MAQTSNEQSRETDVETRERLADRAFDILENGYPKGWFWCSERKDYYRYYDWIDGTGKGKRDQ
jgi:hypothetical protein